MDTKRQNKFSRLIQKDLGEIFQQKSRDWFNGSFITVTQVQVTPDLGIAKVYLSFLMVKDIEAKLEEVEEYNSSLRNLLAQRIRNQARKIPALRFYYDDTMEVSAEVDKMFKEIDIPSTESENDEEKKND